MSTRYAPLPNPHTDPLLNDEMEAAFEQDDEVDSNDDHAESRPLNPSASYASPSPVSRTPTPGIYDFENFDYASLPPPGSPPRPSSVALPNDIGNSNGFIPSPSDVRPVDSDTPRSSWFRRTARNILPSSLTQRFHLDHDPIPSVVGGGTNNDGVFANVTAKPSRPVQLRDGLSSCFYPLSLFLISQLPLTSKQVMMFISSRKIPRRTRHPHMPQPRPTPSRLTGRRPCTPLPHQMT